MSSGRIPVLVLLTASLVVSVSACGQSRQSPADEPKAATSMRAGSAAADAGRVPANVNRLLPMASLSAWLSWGDVAVVATVVAEAKVEANEEHEGPDFRVSRDLSLAVVEVPWTFPGDSQSIKPTDAITVRDAGWWSGDGHLTPLQIDGSVRLEVGNEYFLVLTRREVGGPWSMVVPESAVKVADGGLVADPQLQGSVPGAAALDGVPVGGLHDSLASVQLDQAVVQLHDLPPRERVRQLATAAK